MIVLGPGVKPATVEEALELCEPWVWKKARHAARNPGLQPCFSLDDLVQEARMGVMHAYAKFDPSKNVRFFTYAALWINNRVMRLNVREPMVGQQRKENQLKRGAVMGWGDGGEWEEVGVEALAADLNVEDDCAEHEEARRVRAAMARCEPRDRSCLLAFVKELTLEEAGLPFGVGKERMRQVIPRAVASFRKHCEALTLEDLREEPRPALRLVPPPKQPKPMKTGPRIAKGRTTKMTGISIQPALHAELKAAAAEEGVSVSSLICRFTRQGLDAGASAATRVAAVVAEPIPPLQVADPQVPEVDSRPRPEPKGVNMSLPDSKVVPVSKLRVLKGLKASEILGR